MKFKVGDKVRVVTVRDERKNKYLDTILTVEKVNSQPYFTKEEHYSLGEDYVFFPDELELASFTKADLKDGMVVECSDGSRGMYLNNRFTGLKHFTSICTYTDTLECKYEGKTINKVYTSHSFYLNSYFEDRNLTLIWERPKEEPVKEMTIEEIEKELGYKVKIISDTNN